MSRVKTRIVVDDALQWNGEGSKDRIEEVGERWRARLYTTWYILLVNVDRVGEEWRRCRCGGQSLVCWRRYRRRGNLCSGGEFNVLSLSLILYFSRSTCCALFWWLAASLVYTRLLSWVEWNYLMLNYFYLSDQFHVHHVRLLIKY